MKGVIKDLVAKHTATIILSCLFLCVFVGCVDEKEEKLNLNDIPLESVQFTCHRIDSLIAPRSIHVFDGKLVVLQPQINTKMICFYDSKDFSFLFATGEKGHSKNEFTNLNSDYFAVTDSSFFVLDNNVEREIKIDDGKLNIIRNRQLQMTDAVNQLVRISNDSYITLGYIMTGKDEHILHHDGESKAFGEYPLQLGEKDFIYNFKLCAGMETNDNIVDFYMFQNRVRIYDKQGELQKDIQIEGGAEREMSMKVSNLERCFSYVTFNSQYIVAFYNMSEHGTDVYEIQLWDWQGNLKRRIKVDEFVELFALSEDNILYAMGEPEKIYYCKL